MPLNTEEVLVLRVTLALRLKGSSVNALAEEMGKHQANMYRVIKNPKANSEVWKAITKKAGFDPRVDASKELKELCRQVAFDRAA